MPTTIGYTGQREDATAAGSSGLDYFNARSYDPIVGRFTRPDSLTGSDALLDGYAYVGGMVESATDPSGHTVDAPEQNERDQPQHRSMAPAVAWVLGGYGISTLP